MLSNSRSDGEIRVKYFKNKLKSAISSGGGLAVLGIIFGLFLWETGLAFFEHYAKFVLLPLIALSDIFSAVFAWCQASLEEYEAFTIVKGVVETLAALATTLAVILVFSVPTLPLLVVPIIFTANLSFKTLYNLIVDIYDIYEVIEVDKHREHYAPLLAHTVGFIATMLIAIAAGFALIGGLYIWGIAGLIGASMGLVFAIYQSIQAARGALKCQQEINEVKFSSCAISFQIAKLALSSIVPSVDITDKCFLLSDIVSALDADPKAEIKLITLQ